MKRPAAHHPARHPKAFAAKSYTEPYLKGIAYSWSTSVPAPNINPINMAKKTACFLIFRKTSCMENPRIWSPVAANQQIREVLGIPYRELQLAER
ncbi:MAG: hypothetical protein NT004_12535 [Bacteroidetes bacterium]|nr:hypothetical protein [Bacteroidota bacterium]